MRNDTPSPTDDPHAALELRFIDEFLGSVGHTRRSAMQLGTSEVSALLKAASEYASLQLADIEAKAHYVSEIHRKS